jgi:YfiH family protein
VFAGRETFGAIEFAVTDRFGGVSRPPYAELNLAAHVGDDAHAVAANRRALADALGLPPERLVTVTQVHGAAVHVADGPTTGEPVEADGIVTREPDLVLAVLVADCTPVLFADPAVGVVGAAHAGRKGLAAKVVSATVDAMADLGARVERMHAVVGPGICAEHYEVPVQMREAVEAAAPGSAATTSAGAPALDIRAGIVAELDRLGVTSRSVHDGCTFESPALFSFRREARTGRFAGLVWRASR